MTLTTITVPDRYSYVLLAGIGTGWLTLWQSYGIVARYRKMAKIPYPQGKQKPQSLHGHMR